MMIYLWLAVWGVIIMIATTIGITLLTRSQQKQYPDSQPLYFISGLVLTIACYAISFVYAIQHNLLLSLAGMFPIVCAFLFSDLKLRKKTREFFQIGICLLSVLFLPTALPIFEALTVPVAYVVLALALYLMIKVFVAMDKVPNLSLITLLAQGILLAMLAQTNIIPSSMSHSFFYAFVASMSTAQTVKAFTGRSRLGVFASTIAGFVMGYFWLIVVANGFWLVPVILYSYDVLELVLAGVLTWGMTRHFYPLQRPFLIEQAQELALLPRKLNTFIFTMLVLSSMAAFTIIQREYSGTALVLQALVLISIYMKLKNWGAPKASFKDLKTDLITGLKELKKEVCHIPLKSDKLPASQTTQSVEAKKTSPKKVVPEKEAKSILVAKGIKDPVTPKSAVPVKGKAKGKSGKNK